MKRFYPFSHILRPRRCARRWFSTPTPKIDWKKDYYKILDLQYPCSRRQIQLAFIREAKKWHPDKHADSCTETKFKAVEKFIILKEAYEVLRNEQTKRQYDYYRFPEETRKEERKNNEQSFGVKMAVNTGVRAVNYRKTRALDDELYDEDALERKIKELLMGAMGVRDHPNHGGIIKPSCGVGDALKNLREGKEVEKVKIRSDWTRVVQNDPMSNRGFRTTNMEVQDMKEKMRARNNKPAYIPDEEDGETEIPDPDKI